MSLASVLFTGAMAADISLSVPDFEIEVGKTAKVTVSSIGEGQFCGFQTDLILPEGVSLIDVELDDDFPEGYTQLSKTYDNGITRIIVYTEDGQSINLNGDLMCLTLSADETMPTGDYNLDFTKTLLSTDEGEDVPVDETSVNMKVIRMNGLESIENVGMIVGRSNGRIIISGLNDGENISVYGLSGRLVATGPVKNGKFEFVPPSKGLYLINRSEMSLKLMIH